MQDFRNLKVWEKAHELTLKVYAATKLFPKDELFSLTQQMRRSSSSIATNIAEGCGRSSDADFCRFLWMANGSAKEIDYQILLAKDLGYLNELQHGELRGLASEVMRILSVFIQRLSPRV